VNPLRDLWEGASLEGRELPWTRKEEEEEKREKKESEGQNSCFVDGEMGPSRLCDVLNECYVQSVGPNLQPRGYTEKGEIEP
jgi:hypothetical protein